MDHLHIQANGIATISNSEITIDFSGMPLRQLLPMRRLGEGMSAKWCDDWHEAATSAKKALHRYLDSSLDPEVYSLSSPDYSFRVVISHGDIDEVFQAVVNFFRRENITVERESGIRGLTSA